MARLHGRRSYGVDVDLSKRVFQVRGWTCRRMQLAVDRFFALCTGLPTGCIVAIEACGSAQHVARRLRLLDVDARLYRRPPRHALPHGGQAGEERRQRCGGDLRSRRSAEHALCTVQVGGAAKPADRATTARRLQGRRYRAAQPRSRPDGCAESRSATSHLARADRSRLQQTDWRTRLALQRAQLHWIDIELQMGWCGERIACHVRGDDRATRVAQLLGGGLVTAAALVASVGDFGQFRNARQFGAWLGLVFTALHQWKTLARAYH